MADNFQVWPTIGSMVDNRYYVMRKDGTVEEDIEARETVRRKFLALRAFFQENGLLKTGAPDARGEMADRAFHRDDFTEQGFELFRRKGANWIGSKGSEANPPNMKLLEKALAEIRSGK